MRTKAKYRPEGVHTPNIHRVLRLDLVIPVLPPSVALVSISIYQTDKYVPRLHSRLKGARTAIVHCTRHLLACSLALIFARSYGYAGREPQDSLKAHSTFDIENFDGGEGAVKRGGRG